MEQELQEWLKLHNFYMGDYQTKALADYLKVSTRTIQRWLKEKGKPSPEQLVLIGKYLDTQESRKNDS